MLNDEGYEARATDDCNRLTQDIVRKDINPFAKMLRWFIALTSG